MNKKSQKIIVKPKCEFCGKALKLICPNEWTLEHEKAFELGYKAAYAEVNMEINNKLNFQKRTCRN
jgi:hypothetical protein